MFVLYGILEFHLCRVNSTLNCNLPPNHPSLGIAEKNSWKGMIETNVTFALFFRLFRFCYFILFRFCCFILFRFCCFSWKTIEREISWYNNTESEWSNIPSWRCVSLSKMYSNTLKYSICSYSRTGHLEPIRRFTSMHDGHTDYIEIKNYKTKPHTIGTHAC